MITSPIAGFLLGIVVMVLLWALIAGLAKVGGAIGRLARPRIVNAFFGAQIASAFTWASPTATTTRRRPWASSR